MKQRDEESVMKISGTATLRAPAGQVWAALTDPEVLVATIPGCERLEPAGPDRYRFTLTAGIASLQGTYAGDVALSRLREPSSFTLTASGAGGPGTVAASVQVWLDAVADGQTELRYDADAVIGGLLAGVGQRMLSSVAARLAGEFFAAVNDVLSRNALAPPRAASPAHPAQSEPAQREPAQPPAVLHGQPNRQFVRGVLAGAALTLAGVAVGGRLRRRER
jgi:uncharacterized protein